ncbi:MAG: [LysW]-lysine hydrolase [Chloroflexota bacterium]
MELEALRSYPGHPEYATLLGLLERYSPSGEEDAAVAWLVAHMHALGYTSAFADPAGNAVGVIGAGPRQVLMLGHIDTVPGQIPLRLQDGNIYGRGSVDAKGPLAAFVQAAARLGAVPGWQFVVIGGRDEERQSLGARYVATQYRPDFAIIGEPSQWQRLTLGYKGSAQATLTVRRERAHSASGVENACEAAVGAWGALQAWAAGYNASRPRAFDQALPVLTGLASGEDGFANWASLQVNARLPLELPPQAWYARLDELAAAIPGAVVHPQGYAIPAYLAQKNTPLVRAFLAGIRAAGGQPGFVLKSGTADLNVVAPGWGCPAVAYGPGDSALDHTPGEHLSLEEFSRAVAVLQAVLRQLAHAPA